MKKFSVLLIIVTALSLSVSAQNTSPYWSLAGNSNATTSSKLGTTNSIPLRFLTNNLERMRVTEAGRVGIGTTAPVNILTVKITSGTPASSWITSSAPVFAGFAEAATSEIDLATASNTADLRPVFTGKRSRGTLAAPTRVANNDYITSITSAAYDGSSFLSPAAIHFYVDGTPASGHVPARISFETGTSRSDRLERLKILNNGDFNFNNGQMFVQQSTGNVALGTLKPFRKLQVEEGDVRIETSSSVARYLEFIKPGAPVDWRFEHSGTGRYLYLSYSLDDFSSFVDKAVIDTAAYTSGYSFYLYGKADAYAWDVFSDAKLKKNIKDIQDATTIISKLRSKTYNFNQSAYPYMHLPDQKQYGVIAQEIEQVLPELVTTSDVAVRVNSKGEREMEKIKAVNYIALIPVLIKGFQEQQIEIEQLKSGNEKLQGEIDELKLLLTKDDNGSPRASLLAGGYLKQNIPNPSNNSTTITYYVADNSKKAQIKITDEKGSVVKLFFASKGAGQINIKSGELAGGTYNYTLYVNDKIVDTKKMLITK